MVALRLVGQGVFSKEAKAAERGLKGIGASGDVAAGGLARAGVAGTVASTRLGRAHLAASKFGATLASVGRGAGAAGIAVGAATLGLGALVKTSVEHVTSLGEAAAVLHNVAGLSNNDAIQLAAVAGATGVKTRQLGMTLKTLGTQTTNALQGSKPAVKTFAGLGITMAQVRGAGGNMTKMLTLVAGGMEKTKGGAAKLASTSKLLGRGWMSLNPILEGGGRELRSLTAFAAKLGITLTGNTAKNLAAARDASYRFKLVMMAVQLFVVNKLVPALLATGRWLGQHLGPAFRAVARWARTDLLPALRDIGRWIGQNVVPAVRSLAGWMGGHLVPAVRDTAQWIGNAAGNVGRFFNKIGKSGPVAVLASILKQCAAAASAFAQGIWWIIQRVKKLLDMIPNGMSKLAQLASSLLSLGGGVGTVQTQLPNIPAGGSSGLPGAGPVQGNTPTAQGSVGANHPGTFFRRAPASPVLARTVSPVTASPVLARTAHFTIINHVDTHLDRKTIHRAVYREERAIVERS